MNRLYNKHKVLIVSPCVQGFIAGLSMSQWQPSGRSTDGMYAWSQ